MKTKTEQLEQLKKNIDSYFAELDRKEAALAARIQYLDSLPKPRSFDIPNYTR